MKTQFLIYDNTENTGKPFIAECGSNTGDVESAMKFNSEKEAQYYINQNNLNIWACVYEL